MATETLAAPPAVTAPAPPGPLKLLSLGNAFDVVMIHNQGRSKFLTDGGGIRGIAILIILKFLMKRINPTNPPKPCDYFDLIGGTSTGG